MPKETPKKVCSRSRNASPAIPERRNGYSPSQYIIILRIQFDVVLLEISVELVGTENLGNFY